MWNAPMLALWLSWAQLWVHYEKDSFLQNMSECSHQGLMKPCVFSTVGHVPQPPHNSVAHYPSCKFPVARHRQKHLPMLLLSSYSHSPIHQATMGCLIQINVRGQHRIPFFPSSIRGNKTHVFDKHSMDESWMCSPLISAIFVIHSPRTIRTTGPSRLAETGGTTNQFKVRFPHWIVHNNNHCHVGYI